MSLDGTHPGNKAHVLITNIEVIPGRKIVKHLGLVQGEVVADDAPRQQVPEQPGFYAGATGLWRWNWGDRANPGAGLSGCPLIEEVVNALLRAYDIAYLKWDHNRDLTDVTHAGRPAVHGPTLAEPARGVAVEQVRAQHAVVHEQLDLADRPPVGGEVGDAQGAALLHVPRTPDPSFSSLAEGRFAYVRNLTNGKTNHLRTDSDAFVEEIRVLAAAGHGEAKPDALWGLEGT